ncbi:hypothetical protein CIB84_009243, partial [Bambusicola thoracicus]
SLIDSVSECTLYHEDPLTLSQSLSKSIPTADEALQIRNNVQCIYISYFHLAKTQFAIDQKKFIEFWTNSTAKLPGSNNDETLRPPSYCFTVPK